MPTIYLLVDLECVFRSRICVICASMYIYIYIYCICVLFVEVSVLSILDYLGVLDSWGD